MSMMHITKIGTLSLLAISVAACSSKDAIQPTNPTTPILNKPQTSQPATPNKPATPSKPAEPAKPSKPSQPTTPSKPTNPTAPSKPVAPTKPATPSKPVAPAKPATPSKPVAPTKPATPSKPAEPAKPSKPVAPTKPATPSKPAEPAKPSKPVAPTKPAAPKEVVLHPAPSEPTGKALEAANKAKTLSIPSIGGGSIVRPVELSHGNSYSKTASYYTTGDAVLTPTNYGSGFSTKGIAYYAATSEEEYSIKGNERVYQQPYSIVYGNYYDKARHRSTDRIIWSNFIYPGNPFFQIDQIAGVPTAVNDLPTLGKATYGGGAFSGRGTGSFVYHVDFGTRKGSGQITGMSDLLDIQLLESDIITTTGGGVAKQGIEGKAQMGDYSGSYTLGFYGPKAAEVAGKVALKSRYGSAVDNARGRMEIGFGGTRGAVTK